MKVREVCRFWAGLINSEFKLEKLNCRLFNRPEDLDGVTAYDFYFSSTRTFLDYTRNDPKFNSIKYFRACLPLNYDQLEDAFDWLNSFKSLVDLSLILITLNLTSSAEVQAKKFVVNLEHVNHAYFCFVPGPFVSKVSVLLNLPSLQHICVNSLRSITIGHPERVLSLGILDLFAGDPDYSQFTKTEYIFTSGSHVRSISASFIEKLPSLRKLDLDDIYKSPHYLPAKLAPGVKKAVKIFYFGFEISLEQINLDSAQWPNSFYSSEPTEDSTRFVARNLHRSINDNKFVLSLHYNLVVSELDDTKMFEVISEKFPDLCRLHVSETVTDEELLLDFIDDTEIEQLTLERAALSSWFFEELPDYGSSIQRLVVKTEPTMDILAGDFDFIFKLENLLTIHFQNSPLPLAFVARLLKELEEIALVSFKQTGAYEFDLRCCCAQEIRLSVEDSHFLSKTICREEAAEFVDVLQHRLAVDGFVCPKELLVLLRHLELEEQTHLFMMRKYVYEQRNSIALSPEQMHLLNLRNENSFWSKLHGFS